MTISNRAGRPDVAPALSRLLAESALSRAALGCCGIPLALVDAGAKIKCLTYVNAAFEAFFGYRESEAVGRPLSALLFRNDEALVVRLLAEQPRRWELSAWGRDGEVRHVEAALTPLRDAEGNLTHHIVSFSDRSEVERLRAEVESLRSLAAANLGLHVDPSVHAGRAGTPGHLELDAAEDMLREQRLAQLR